MWAWRGMKKRVNWRGKEQPLLLLSLKLSVAWETCSLKWRDNRAGRKRENEVDKGATRWLWSQEVQGLQEPLSVSVSGCWQNFLRGIVGLFLRYIFLNLGWRRCILLILRGWWGNSKTPGNELWCDIGQSKKLRSASNLFVGHTWARYTPPDTGLLENVRAGGLKLIFLRKRKGATIDLQVAVLKAALP